MHFAARAVVREVMLTLELRRFPEKRWHDWLCRRAECYARLSRRLRPRLLGDHDREWLRLYMRNWLFSALRRTGHPLADCLPSEMWAGENPLPHGVVSWRRWRLPHRPAA